MSFDALAPTYRGLEALVAGPLLQRCRTAFLAESGGCRRALLLGEGPGRFLVEVLRTNPRLEITCVERSPGMIREAANRVRRAGLDTARVRFEQRDVLAWSPRPEGFDLIVSHFFLDCFRPAELGRLIPRVASGATPEARWLVGDFRVPDRGWQRLRALAVHRLMYAFFRIVTGLSAARLTPPDRFLEAVGFTLSQRRYYNFGLLHSDCWRRSLS